MNIKCEYYEHRSDSKGSSSLEKVGEGYILQFVSMTEVRVDAIICMANNSIKSLPLEKVKIIKE